MRVLSAVILPRSLFSGGMRRATDIPEGEMVDPAAFNARINEAVAFNIAKQKSKRP
jgi:hypothetical protein